MQPNKGVRRPHRKSRLGCGNCKSRKIKCDEIKPECGNCVRHSIPCDFARLPCASATTGNSGPRVRFVPSRYQTEVTPTSRDTGDTSSPAKFSPSSASSDCQDSFSLSVPDLVLLHHFSTSTSHTFGDDPGSLAFWQINLPQMGFSHQFVLHLILALSALHLGHCRPDRRSSYVAQAERHYVAALQTVATLLPRLDAGNCDAVYMSAVIICFYHLGRGPRPGDFLAFSKQGEAEWLVLLRGVRSIIESKEDTLHEGILAPIVHSNDRQVLPEVECNRMPNFKEPMKQLREFIARKTAIEGPNTQTYLQALDSLSQSFIAIYEGQDSSSDESNRFDHIIFAWLYRASDNYNRCLQEKQPFALIIFAYFTVLLKELDSQWFMRGWVEHIMVGIYGFLPDEFRVWIHWPRERVGWVPG